MGGTLDSKKTSHISDEEYAAGWRLACISKIIDDVEVLVPDIASAYKSRMKMADLSSAEEVKIFEELKEQIAEVGIELKNNLEVIDVTMSAPTLDDTMPDNERFTWAVEEVTGMDKIRASGISCSYDPCGTVCTVLTRPEKAVPYSAAHSGRKL